jgi:DNA-binding response OmpR family regulator
LESSIKILVLDDQPEIREIISDIVQLNYDEIQIDEAEDFDQAMSLTSKNKYNVLLVDINLGGKSGMDFIQETRLNEGDNKSTPIFVITGSPKTVESEIEKYDNILLFSKVDGIESLTSNLAEALEV